MVLSVRRFDNPADLRSLRVESAHFLWLVALPALVCLVLLSVTR